MLRTLIISIFILSHSFSYSQDTLSIDTAKSTLTSAPTSETVVKDQTYTQNYDYILELQRQNRAKKKKQAWLYIGMGVFFLVVLVVGLSRRKKR